MVKITKEEALNACHAVDELIKKWENFGVPVDASWYLLKNKLEGGVKKCQKKKKH